MKCIRRLFLLYNVVNRADELIDDHDNMSNGTDLCIRAIRAGLYHRCSQDFCLGGTRPTQPSLASVEHTFEAVTGSWGSVSAPAVNRVMGGAPERKKIAKNYVK